jgi:hypothetical protein
MMGVLMKGASVYAASDTLFLSPSSLTTAGVWVGTQPVLRLEPGSGPSVLGEAVIRVLNASHDNLPHPTDWNALLRPLLESAGARSWAAFMNKAKCVCLRFDGEEMKLIPHRNLGTEEGYQAIEELITTLRFPSSPVEIGEAVNDSVSRCQ